MAAVNARHATIQEEDITSAERLYSQFALEALLVENGISVSQLEEVLYEFAGADATLTRSKIKSLLGRASVDDQKLDEVIAHLRALSFLGAEIREDDFAFAEDVAGLRKQDGMMRTLMEQLGREPRFQVHPAFRSYLEIVE